ncbi:carboxypeptidase-like regulatory domain-containing protein [Gillisia sp. M10.2A]|uniref:Carboxypeptidase-like regulatory domain-containing protein n=1 Tax=Gillisia lutea TaxID=2909668 RepID=A0ABS9EHS6_9FLAO|nr:kelch repeat-containing protein [Gillisia lutea]MCF4101887.1 carboxypeptidase-like regulatory domain-containing protein [Gillisia lutea]
MTKQNLYFIILGIFFITEPFYTQELRGRIIESENKKPLENVNIYNKRTGFGTTSNSVGKFYLNEDIKSSDSLIFSHIGYQTEIGTISEFKSAAFLMELQKKIDDLDLVDISSKNLNDQMDFLILESIPKALYAFSTNIINGELFVIAGNESEETKQALKLLDRYSDLELDDFLKALIRKPNTDWASFSSKIYRYDFSTKNWANSKKAIIPRAYHNSEVLNDKIYIYGGKTLSTNHWKEYLPNKVEIYDVKNDTLLIDETNPHMAVNFASFTNDSLIFLMGGSIKEFKNTNRKQYTNKVHVFNSKTGYWSELGAMPEGKETSGVLVDGIFYLIGGYKGEPLNSIETYNLSNGRWQRIGKLFTPMERPAISKKDHMIYIYDEKRILSFNTFTKILKEFQIDIDLYDPKMVLYENNIFILGGFSKSEFKLKPSKEFYKIPIENFKNTKIKRQRTFDSL